MKSRIRIGFAQTNPLFGKKEENVEEVIDISRRVESDIMVFPELFNTGYAFTSREEARFLAEEVPNGYTTMKLIEYSIEAGNTIVAGLAERYGDKVFNSAVVVSKGQFVGKYRKIHLFYKEKLWFSPGDEGFKVFNLGLFRLGVMICFDWFFPESARILALEGADIIAHPSNLVLPGLCQKAMLIRSLENKVFTITANRTGSETRGGDKFEYTGKSQITSPSMEVLSSANKDEVVAKAAYVDILEARDKKITKFDHALDDRRVEFYRRLVET
ncbi:MAG: nitrilase-related carbon-nitrogen hydrolase [Nitrososphaerales archaeon]